MCQTKRLITPHRYKPRLDRKVWRSTIDDDHDEFLILPHGSYQVSVAQPIYEMISVGSTRQKSSPGCMWMAHFRINPIKTTRRITTQRRERLDNNDPRWDKLKDLL